MTSLVLGRLDESPQDKFDSLYGISNEVCTVQPIVAVRYTNLSKTITRMTTSNSSTIITSLVLVRPDENPRDKFNSLQGIRCAV